MCELCSQDKEEKARAIASHISIGDSLLELANDYKYLAHGLTKPHTDEAGRIRERAIHLIRVLVNDWL